MVLVLAQDIVVYASIELYYRSGGQVRGIGGWCLCMLSCTRVCGSSGALVGLWTGAWAGAGVGVQADSWGHVTCRCGLTRSLCFRVCLMGTLGLPAIVYAGFPDTVACLFILF
jgi:hypothetical protein